MPLIIKEFSWHQTPVKISLQIPFPNTKNADIFITEEYLKITSKPYFFEAFLPSKIDVDQSYVKITDKSIDLELCKNPPQTQWENLCLQNLDRDSAKLRREEATKWRHQYEENKSKEKVKNTRERERQATEYSLDAFEKNRQKLEQEKLQSRSDFFKEPKQYKEIEYNTELAAKVAVEKSKKLPPVRNSATLEFSFNERQFPGPKRESNQKMEEEWARKQKEALAKMDIDEIQPDELLKKAEKFFQVEDFDSSLEAYNYGVTNYPNYAPFWNNRAAVHLKLGNFAEAIKDTSKALQLMDPPVDSNAKMRAKAYIRRGAALAEMKSYKEAIVEFQAAEKILPEDQSIGLNVKKLQSLIDECSDDSD